MARRFGRVVWSDGLKKSQRPKYTRELTNILYCPDCKYWDMKNAQWKNGYPFCLGCGKPLEYRW